MSETKTAGAAEARGLFGLRRGVQLLTGSRVPALEAQAASRAASSARHNAVSGSLGKRGVFDEGLSDQSAYKALHNSVRSGERSKSVHRSSLRSAQGAERERAAVSSARRTAGQAIGAGALGVGGGVVGAHTMGPKTANLARAFQAARETAPSGKRLVKKLTSSAPDPLGATRPAAPAVKSAPAKSVVRPTTPAPTEAETTIVKRPALSQKAKIIGGTALAGTAAGVSMGHRKESSALSIERQEQIKEAFGNALVAGLKGIGQFAGKAGGSIVAAGKAGGMPAAGQAAMNAGRAGALRAGNFISQNPGAGAAMVAAPALAAGYVAGRQ